MNIIHRDVSPQNILISFDGEVKMIDFGIAKAANRASKTQVGVLKGKFAYMSPEQVRGLPIDRRSDVFAVGIVLYEMLTGERLFIAESDFSTLQRVRDAVVETPTSFNRNIPGELEQIVLKALARDVEDRYQWASELAEALQPFLIQGRTIYGPKKMGETIREDYAPEVAAERAKMEHFRTVGGEGDQFGGASEETEPQDSESYGLPDVPTSSDETGENDFSEDSEGETIIFEASRAGSILEQSLGLGEKQPDESHAQTQDASITAESDAEGFHGSEDADATIVQMTSPFFRKQEPNMHQAQGAATDVSEDAKNESDADQNHDITGVDDAARGTLPSNESDMATMAIPIEELRKGDARFQEFSKDDPNKLSTSGDNPSLTLPENSDANDLVGSNESTAAAQEPLQDEEGEGEGETGGFSYTADTVGLAPEDAEAIFHRGRLIDTRDFTVGSGTGGHAPPVRPATNTWQGGVSANAITASQSVAPEDKPDLGQSIGSQGGSFSEFYGSRKSANPVIALLASWIRVVPKPFRAPVFMAIGAVFALLLVLMAVATQRVFNTPMGQIELQKVGELPLPSGIQIFLDGTLVGDKLPLRLSEVSPGKHMVKAEAPPPCENAEFEVTVLENQAAFIPIPIYCGNKNDEEKAKAPVFTKWEVNIRAVDHRGRAVKNARVYIGGKKAGVTPFSTLLPRETASVDIRLEASGYKTKKLTAAHNGIEKPPSIVVDLGVKKETAGKSAALAPKKNSPNKVKKMATLELLVRPDATVFVDGKSTGNHAAHGESCAQSFCRDARDRVFGEADSKSTT